MGTRSPEFLRRGLPTTNGSAIVARLAREIDVFCTLIALIALAAIVSAPFRTASIARATDVALAHSDFGAFYCGALVARVGGDPYRLAPLASCESSLVYAPGRVTMHEVGIDPAPLPAYDFAFFAPFTSLPYRDAGIVWLAMLVVAYIGAAIALRRLTRLPLALTIAAFAYGGGAISFTYGQEQPFVTLSLACAALALAGSRDRLAVLCATPTLLEPQIGVPTMLALLLFSRARATALGVLGAIGVLSLSYLGPERDLEYLARVLPAHAFSELGISIQYGAASLLFALGVPDMLALRIASVQYVVVALAGVALAAPLSRRIGRPALVLAPAACAVFGGTFMHIQEIASALPLALYLAGRVPASRPWSAIAVALIALPWPAYGGSNATLLMDAVIVGALFLALRPYRTVRGNAACATALFAAYAASAHAFHGVPERVLHPAQSPAIVAIRGFDPSLASTQLAREWRESPESDGATIHRIGRRLPTWLGQIVLLGITLALAIPTKRRTTATAPP